MGTKMLGKDDPPQAIEAKIVPSGRFIGMKQTSPFLLTGHSCHNFVSPKYISYLPEHSKIRTTAQVEVT